MITVEYPYAGLVLPDASDLDPGPYLDAAATILARFEPDHPPRVLPRSNQVLGESLGILVVPEEDSDYGPRMVIEITGPDGGMPDDEIAAQVLSDTVLLALETSQADILEWYSPDVLIDRDDFIRLRNYVSPRRASQEEAQTEEAFSEETLTQSLRAMLTPETGAVAEPRPASTDRLSRYRIPLEQEEPQSRPIKSAGWLMTGAVGVFAAPLALFLFLVSLYRGMDFRLVSQAVAVTALFVVLYNTDRLQMVLHQFVH